MAKGKKKPAKKKRGSKATRKTSRIRARNSSAVKKKKTKKKAQSRKRASKAKRALGKDLVDALSEGISREQLEGEADAIERSARECVSLSLDPYQAPFKLGQSRFGGVPDLPGSAPWPLSAHGYLTFVAQLNLSDLPKMKGRPLPPSGWLYLFLGSDERTSEVEHVVKYVTGRTAIQPRATPAGARALNPCAVSCELAVDLPGKGAPERKGWQLAAGSSGRLRALRGSVGGDYPRLLGYPSCTVDDPRETAALIRDLRRRPFDLTWQSRNRHLVDGARARWRHLLSLASDSDLGLAFPASGVLQVVIRSADLKARSFSRTHACVSFT